eukprot:SAG31_NODE_919_length_11010_cov_27.449821_9_plen_92_part_00
MESEDKRLLVQWFKEEDIMDQRRWRPRNSSDADMDETDPHMVVLFEDVSAFLCTYSSMHIRSELAAALLSFLGADLPVEYNACADNFKEVR